MSDAPKPVPASRNRTHWLLVAGLVGVVIAVNFGRPLLEFFRGRPPEPPPAEIKIPPKPEDVAKPHLSHAEREAERAIEKHVKTLDTFFADSKKNTRAFADEALSLPSKITLVGDQVPSIINWWYRGPLWIIKSATGSDLSLKKTEEHQKFIRSKFEEHVFDADQLEEAVKQVVRGYLADIRSIESKMLVDLRADVSDFPTAYILAKLDDKRLQESYDQALSRAIAATGADIGADIGITLASTIAGQVLTQVAVQLGVSAGILGTGAASGWATFGIGVVVGLIVDQIVSWVWDWWADPRGSLAADLDEKLDEMNRLIVDGSSNVQGLRDRLKQFAQERAAARKAAVLSLLQSTGGGAE